LEQVALLKREAIPADQACCAGGVASRRRMLRNSTMATKRKRRRVPWNKGKIVAQKAPLKLREIWAVGVRLQLRSNLRDLALFNFAIDSKLRACDLFSLRVRDIAHESHVNSRAVVMQRKTRRPVQFESRVDQAARRICLRDSTPESFTAGSGKSAWTAPPAGSTPCGERRRR
jgi:hypothetical protein